MNIESNPEINPTQSESLEQAETPSIGEIAQRYVSSIAITLLEENRRKGHDIRIPSLGIVIKGELQESEKNDSITLNKGDYEVK